MRDPAVHRLGQAVEQEGAVGQAGQRVVGGLVGQAGLGLVGGAHVDDLGEQEGSGLGLGAVTGEAGERDLAPHDGAVGAHESDHGAIVEVAAAWPRAR